jgi:hypothetical protein
MVNKKFHWQVFIDWLIVNDRLSMVCVDEVHLFVHFGMTLCGNFKLLTPCLFNKLKAGQSTMRTKIQLLFMTCTCTKGIMVESIKKIVGIMFDMTNNVFWPLAEEMKHHQVHFDCSAVSTIITPILFI